jgi:hypothetical protein
MRCQQAGALSLKGNVASGTDDLTYDVTISCRSRRQEVSKPCARSSAAPKVDTAEFPPTPALLGPAGMAGPEANKLGKIAATGSMAAIMT